MQDIFYLILCAIIISVMIESAIIDRTMDENKYKGSLTIEKRTELLFGKVFVLKTKYNTIERIHPYQIFYDKYKVGDYIGTKPKEE